LPKGRIETLADGVFAIAMTLLVLDLRVPQALATGQVLPLLRQLAPNFLTYALSFANLGVYWVGHHVQFDSIRRADTRLLWINIVFLLLIGLIPFSTALLGAAPLDPMAVQVYGANLLLAGLALLWSWRYATEGRRLVDPDLGAERVRLGTVRSAVGGGVSVLAMALAFLDTRISIAIFSLVPLYFIFPAAFHRLRR
jgi:uncharacterized membrane protein